MQIFGIYDNHQPSGLSSAVELLKKRGDRVINYGNFPLPNDVAPPKFVIHPEYTMREDYWRGMREAIQAHQSTKFLVAMPHPNEEIEIEHAKEVLAGLENVVFAGPLEVGVVCEFMGV